MSLRSAEPVQQVFGHQQEIRHAREPPGLQVGVQLIHGIERLELDARAPIQFRKGHFVVHLGDDRFRAPVTIGVTGQDGLIAPHQHIVHAPGVDGEAGNVRETAQRLVDARPHMRFQSCDIPGQAAVVLLHAVGKAVNFPGLDPPVLQPAHDVPP